MKIESIIKRTPPTEIVLGDSTYSFKPDSRGRHVAEVTDKHHIARLLSISEGYQLVDADEGDLPKGLKKEIEQQIEERSTPAATLGPVDENILKGSTVHPATIDIKGEQISIEDVIFQAHELSGMTTAEWNAMPEDARHDLIDAVLDDMADEDIDPANPEVEDESSTDAPKPDEGKPAEKDSKPAAKPAAKKPAAEDKADPEREAAAKEYKEKLGKLPHGKWNAEKIREELAKGEGK